MIDGYEYAPHRWFALRDREPLGLKVRGRLSPFLLAQELVAEPWQVAVACYLLNRTRRQQAHPALWRLLARYQTVKALCLANELDIYPLVRSCGFGRRRAEGLRQMAHDFLNGAMPVHGFGEYANQSWMIFVRNMDVHNPDDHELRRYTEWLRES